MKRFFLSAALCAVAFLVAACGGGGGGSPDVSARSCTVELNADSFCAAHGIPNTCAQLIESERAGWKVDDRAVSGLTLSSLANGYTSAWVGGPTPKNGPQPPFSQAPHGSDFVVIALGVNDAYEARAPEVYRAQLLAAVNVVKAAGRVPVLTGLLPLKASSADYFPGGPFDQATVDRAAAFNAIQHAVAAESGALDAHLDSLPFNPGADTIDGIHRTQEAMRPIARRLADTIAPHCSA